MNAVDKYHTLKMCADAAYDEFNNNPTRANSDCYGMALNELRDFCVEVMDELVISAPEVVSSIKIGG